jgi:hypothetical protein
VPKRVPAGVFLALPILALVVAWFPEVAHYSAPHQAISDEVVDRARAAPSDDVLVELSGFSLLPSEGQSPDDDVAIAQGILVGRLALPDLPAADIHVPFSPADLDGLPESLQLPFAAFVVPDVLLGTYQQTGREEFFTAAAEYIEAWDWFERHARFQKGLLWNDHAIAARVRVLGDFWRLYRHRSDYRPEMGRAVLEQAARYGHFLSSPGHFTFATNHGLIQNQGLLHLALAFPNLPNAAAYRQVGAERMGRQLGFLLDENGFIRENSPGYQAFDLHILALSFRSLTLLGEPIPTDWARAYRAGLSVLEAFQRADDTMPAIGDTDGGIEDRELFATHIDANGRSSPLSPLPGTASFSSVVGADAGYWIRWTPRDEEGSGGAWAQTVLSWTQPPGPAHKHADELGVQVWSDGVAWLTAIGYWPITDPDYAMALGWDGSNAPHRLGEPFTSVRTSRLIADGALGPIGAVQVERAGPDGYHATRQLVTIGTDVWIVVDHVVGAAGANHTTWTTSPLLDVQPSTGSGGYILRLPRSSTSGRLELQGSTGTAFELFSGSEQPFAGWHVIDGAPQPATAVAVTQPGDEAWLVTTLLIADEDEPSTRPMIERMGSEDDWSITVDVGLRPIEVEWSSSSVRVSGYSSQTESLVVALEAAVEGAGSERAVEAFNSLAQAYPVYVSQSTRRTAVSVAVIGLALLGELVIWAARRFRPRVAVALRLASVACWIALAVWIAVYYLQPWVVLSVA